MDIRAEITRLSRLVRKHIDDGLMNDAKDCAGMIEYMAEQGADSPMLRGDPTIHGGLIRLSWSILNPHDETAGEWARQVSRELKNPASALQDLGLLDQPFPTNITRRIKGE